MAKEKEKPVEKKKEVLVDVKHEKKAEKPRCECKHPKCLICSGQA